MSLLFKEQCLFLSPGYLAGLSGTGDSLRDIAFKRRSLCRLFALEGVPMNIREGMELRELELLSPYAAHSGHSRGRERPEEECDIRTVYQRDRDRILHSKSFRRLKDKTQVFLAPQGIITGIA